MREAIATRTLTLPTITAWRAYYELCKPRVVALITFTAVVGMFLATPGLVPAGSLLFGTLGIALGAAAGAAFNQLVDRRADAVMARTMRRPLPTGQLDARRAFLFASALCVISFVVLASFVNLLTAVLTEASLSASWTRIRRRSRLGLMWSSLVGRTRLLRCRPARSSGTDTSFLRRLLSNRCRVDGRTRLRTRSSSPTARNGW